MTATSLTSATNPAQLGAHPNAGRATGSGLIRLARVESRKLTDTRAGFWLLVSVALAMLVAMAGMLVALKPADLDTSALFGVISIPAGLLLPVLAVLLVTSEWSQRTGLVTFITVPRRSRIVLAKLLACLFAAAVAFAVTLLLAVVGTLIAREVRDGAGSWDLSGHTIAYAATGWAVGMLTGFGFGLLLRNSAAGVVAIFALPALWTLISSVVPWLHKHVQPWADLQSAQTPFRTGDVATVADWRHLGVAAAIWVLAPILLGTWRVLRAEIR